MELASGTMVNANVRLTRPLGQGAMGEVWVAQHLTLRTEVAVKFITPELGGKNDEVLSRFEQEAALAAQIKSPHVVQTFDQGTMADGTPFIVMELLDGESLQELLDRSERVPPAAALQIVSQVARALSKAHKLGIVHRDIKPDNIFITHGEDGIFCKILDFGIAKQTRLPKMGGLTHAGIMIGTPEYMSPEQVMSAKDVDGHADIWALAATTYQMLTGYLAFEGEAIGELCVKLLEGRYLAATELCPDLPVELDAFFKKAFQRNKNHRHQSARELARALYGVFPDANDPMLDTLDALDSTRPPPVAVLPNHKLSTRPGVVTDALLGDDVAQQEGGAAILPDGIVPAGEVDSVGRPRRAASATLNGSTANRAVPDEVTKRKVGGWVGIAVAAAFTLTIGGVGLMVALSGGAADQDAPRPGTELSGTGTGSPAAPADDAAPSAQPTLAMDDEADGVAAGATPPPTSSAAATAARSAAASAATGATSAERRPPSAGRQGAPAAASSGVHRDHGF